MKKTTFIIAGLLIAFGFGFYMNSVIAKEPENLKLGVFSVSLSVKDLKVSKVFYENLGFSAMGGGMEQNYLIMKNEHAIIGLFQGMFQGNILTFNPGWDENAKNIEKFDDIREIQKQLKLKGIVIDTPADEKTTGPASFMTKDPDGNVILLDQHR
jgi:catechol 2,3-dioxygenase-like lactoylglutathione lyase family enzyme